MSDRAGIESLLLDRVPGHDIRIYMHTEVFDTQTAVSGAAYCSALLITPEGRFSHLLSLAPFL